MLLVSAASHTKSTIIVGVLSKLNEDKWVLYNTGRSVIDSKNFTKIKLTREENNMLAILLNSDNSNNSDIILKT